MIKKKIVSREVEEIDDIVCNMCGESLKVYLDIEKTVFNFGGIENAEMICGYESKFDGTSFSFSLCEKCVHKLLKKFKIPATIKDIGFWQEPGFDEP
jgi:hypothetical protein